MFYSSFCLLVALVLFKLKFNRTWLLFWTINFSVYLALWTAPLLLPVMLKLGKMERSLGIPFALLLLLAIMAAIFFKLFSFLGRDMRDFPVFTPLQCLGVVLNYAALNFLFGFLCFVFTVSPASKWLPNSQNVRLSKFTFFSLINGTHAINCLSRQPAWNGVVLSSASGAEKSSEKNAAETAQEGGKTKSASAKKDGNPSQSLEQKRPAARQYAWLQDGVHYFTPVRVTLPPPPPPPPQRKKREMPKKPFELGQKTFF